MPEVKEKKHFCPASSDGKKNNQIICAGAIKGKVLAVERVSNKQNNKGQKSWKIRISEWKDSKFDQEYVVLYNPEDYSKKPLRKFPKAGKVYWFFLHKFASGSPKNNQRGWQLVHDWQLAEEDKSESDILQKSNLWPWLIGGLIALAVIIGVIVYFWRKNK
ncbi:hypothetical protein [endosymbiont DhMRE of Dentiscutata heterogama]|uniref:hypothetical protein n=1 Tax=endosymbiont DhMRE of Dentiscutata heterogama TaxID=1609546 RepID=UPI002AD49D5C|nr:hypothetical protein [endosymbiont DhMRE of Dentiscutata heterogama]